MNLDREYIEQLSEMAEQSRQEADLTTAIACYQKILNLQPQRSDIYLQLGNIFNEQQQCNKAVSAYQTAVDLTPEQPAWVYQTLGKAYQQQELDREAISTYQKAIALDPQEPWVYRNLGTLLTKTQQYDRAIAIYDKLIELQPPFASEIYIKIGDIYWQQEQVFLAKAAYKKANWSRTLFNINEVIDCIHQYFAADAGLLEIDILDNGCDPTGRQLALLAEQTKGRVVGTNVFRGFPDATIKRRRLNNEFYWMDGQDLSFEDNSFDLVVSLNVLEHVPNPAKYLQECYRVLRPKGIGFFSWYPLWSGATGHHVHPDMVSRMAQRLSLASPNYSLDGSAIPFWGHLIFDPDRMLSFLVEEKKYDLKLATWMRDYIYYGKDLNRWFWRDVWRSFESLAWDAIEVDYRGKQQIAPEINSQLELKYGRVNDFSICGAKIVVRK